MDIAPIAQPPGGRSTFDLSPKFLFVIGAPRSGTSWIQKTLAAQDGWVTVPELHYATEVLRPVLKAWKRRAAVLEMTLTALEHTGHQPGRLIGMPASLEFGDLAQALRAPFDLLAARGAATYGSVDVFIEKSPGNSILTSNISEVFPEAYILHVLRDPRAMVRSLLSAGKSEWAARWAPRSVLICALMWRAYVASGRRGQSEAMHYLEVTYEDATRSLPSEVVRIRNWLGMPTLSTDMSQVTNAGRHEIVSTRIARILGANPIPEPEGFGDGSSVRPELTRWRVWLIEAVTAELMEQCGYSCRYRTARSVNRILEHLLSRPMARLRAEQKEDLALNLRRLRIFSWIRENLRFCSLN